MGLMVLVVLAAVVMVIVRVTVMMMLQAGTMLVAYVALLRVPMLYDAVPVGSF
jgi:hypothetical protein